MVSSIKRNFEVVRSVFNVAAKEDGLDIVNPFSRMILSSAPPGRKRKPIPIGDIWQTQQLCFKKDDDIRCLIALLSDTGMRLAEAAGLAKDNVFLDTEIPYVRLCERPWRPLKTRSSERDLPLVGAALWAAQRAYESSPNEYLFPRYCTIEKCKADYASSTLNKWLRQKIAPSYVAHSFRHSFRDRLRSVECPSDIVDQMGGWSTSSIGQQYGHGYPLAVKHKWLLKIVRQVSAVQKPQ